MAPQIFPVGTVLLGSLVYECHKVAKVTGYNAKKTVMHLYTAPSQFDRTTKRKARWSEVSRCWRYKTEGRWYVSLHAERWVDTEARVLAFMNVDRDKQWSKNELYPSTLDTEVLTFVLHHLHKDGKIKRDPDTNRFSVTV